MKEDGVICEGTKVGVICEGRTVGLSVKEGR